MSHRARRSIVVTVIIPTSRWERRIPRLRVPSQSNSAARPAAGRIRNRALIPPMPAAMRSAGFLRYWVITPTRKEDRTITPIIVRGLGRLNKRVYSEMVSLTSWLILFKSSCRFCP